MHEVSWNVHLNLRGPHPHLQQELVQVDILWADRVGGSVVSDEIEFDFNNPEHGGLEHVLEKHAFLWMYELVVAVFQNLIAVDVFDVEMGIKSEPLLVFALIFKLRKSMAYSLFVEIFVQRVKLLVDILEQLINSLLPEVIVISAWHPAGRSPSKYKINATNQQSYTFEFQSNKYQSHIEIVIFKLQFKEIISILFSRKSPKLLFFDLHVWKICVLSYLKFLYL